MPGTLTQAEARQHKLQAQRGNMRSLEILLEHLLGGDITLDNLDVTALSIGGTLIDATALEINRAADVSSRIVDLTAATLTVTEALHDGRIILSDLADGHIITMPEATGSGMVIQILVKTTYTSDTTIVLPDTVNTDLQGFALISDSAADTVHSIFTPAATHDLVTLNGGTTGGLLGTTIKYVDIATDLWQVEIIDGTGAATQATPFSST